MTTVKRYALYAVGRERGNNNPFSHPVADWEKPPTDEQVDEIIKKDCSSERKKALLHIHQYELRTVYLVQP